VGKGYGRIQLAIINAIKEQPRKFFTIEEFAAISYPGVPLESKHKDRVSRAVNSLVDELGLMKRRVALPGGLGWRNEFIKVEVFDQMVLEARKKRQTTI